jgi:hypothetical protein
MKSVLALALILAAIVGAQEKPKDVDGWGKIKWGMTLDQVRAAYGDETTVESNEYWTHLTLPPVKVGDIALKPSASAKHGSKQITLIRLWESFGLPGNAPSAGPSDFETLRTLLIQKYGSPTGEESKREYGDPVRMALWTFSSTSIQLTLTQKDRMPSLGKIELEYKATDKKALDVL